ncbi:MAG: M20/M25/M40 family metallo-hydrolase [Bacteroidota bacterium]
MKDITTLLLGAMLLCSLPTLSAQESVAQDELMDIRVDLVYLASDYLQGRKTGTEGETLAANYIAHRFQEIGLQPAGDENTYFQAFPFEELSNPHAKEAVSKGMGKNVIAYLDNGAEYTIIIGAHYDHLGMGETGSRYAGEPAIHNGADDNASGVAALLWVAEQLKSGRAKKNNYLFIGFSGEEMGLFGSKHFVNEPTIDLAKVNYMLNMDMVGMMNKEKIIAINGAGTSPVWKDQIDKIQVGGIEARTSDSGIGPSDHSAFYLKKIPVLHFFTGQHDYYHKPSDDSHLINFKGIHLLAEFMVQIIEGIDDQGKIAFTQTRDEQRKRANFKVTLGVMPDYVFRGKGMRIDGVLEGRTADQAGMEDGDVILKIGDTNVNDIYDYMEGLSKYKKGDKAKVTIKRGEEKMEKEVVF